jgi:hypothetical protein
VPSYAAGGLLYTVLRLSIFAAALSHRCLPNRLTLQKETLLLNALARNLIQRMERRYDCDMSYAHYLLEKAPKAFGKFMRAAAMSRHREQVPVEAAYTVQLMATMHEDCGPCTQIVVRLAEESTMSADQIEAVLTGRTSAMQSTVTLAYRFADAVLNRRTDILEAREAVRAQWADRGLIDLAMNMQGARLYPMMKQALGFALQCQRVSLHGRWIEVARTGR